MMEVLAVAETPYSTHDTAPTMTNALRFSAASCFPGVHYSNNNLVSYIEDDVCVVSFADSPGDDPTHYLILSQALFDCGEDDEEISVEYGRNGGRVNTEVIAARLDAKSFTMKVDPVIVGVSAFNIGIASPVTDELREHLKNIFSQSPTKLALL
ncbi:hypothetical protein [Burkholderia sp. Ac-20349]|uniref:hypothetical protein n=1 Tax=Burkholderia sp. Ac-20349 TaxID=2703893 RepID=UPI00197B1FBF|nr:hypothetical protein [Burkholderia sp. Ac-20349]MBN3838263.1 hypothetical protein [Burkholderia sp. Ac-20349]